jgi:hypothetical protein
MANSAVNVKLMRNTGGGEIHTPNYEDEVEDLLCELRTKKYRKPNSRVRVIHHEDGPLIEIGKTVLEAAVPALIGLVGLWLKNKADEKYLLMKPMRMAVLQ